MSVITIALTCAVLAGLLAFNFRAELSRFEINRLAEHNRRYKTLAMFLDIYPGLKIFVYILALIDAILLTSIAVLSWGFISGGAVAFGAVLLAWLVGRMLHKLAAQLVAKNLEFFNKYFAWVEGLGRLIMVGDDPHIGSEVELLHLVQNGDFLDDETKNLIKNALSFKDKTARSIMTPRDNINFVHSRDSLTPKLLDELFVSGHKVFPVIQNSVDHTVGLLYLDDVLPLNQTEKALPDVARKFPPPIDQAAPLESVLRQMAEYHSPVLLVEKDGKVVGLLTMSDVTRALFKMD